MYGSYWLRMSPRSWFFLTCGVSWLLEGATVDAREGELRLRVKPRHIRIWRFPSSSSSSDGGGGREDGARGAAAAGQVGSCLKGLQFCLHLGTGERPTDSFSRRLSREFLSSVLLSSAGPRGLNRLLVGIICIGDLFSATSSGEIRDNSE